MAEYLRHLQSIPQRALSQQLLDRWKHMQQQLQIFGPDWDDIVDLVAPMCAHTQRLQTPGQSRTRFMYDPTAMTDNKKLAAHLMGNVTNQAIDWHQLQMQDGILKDDQEVQAWLATVNTHLMSVYNASNFYQSWHTFYLHYAALGTAAMYCGDSQTAPTGSIPGQVFQVVPQGSYGILEDADGRVRTLFRTIRYTASQAVQVFRNNVSKNVIDQAKDSKRMDNPITFLHACYPREDWDAGSLNNKKMPYACVYMEVDTEHINDESGYFEFPYGVARWEKLADTPWGFGPGHMALPDTRTLNRMKELQIQMLALWVQPPLKQVHEGVLGNISFEPLAINVVRRPDDLTPFELTGRPDLVQISQEDLRNSLHDIFHVSGLEAVPSADESPRTAYEISQRIALHARLMGPAFHRLITEAMTPLVDRSFACEWRKKRIPQPPVQILEAAARNMGGIDIEYKGPMARAQKSADMQAIVQYYALGAQIAQAKQLAQAVGGPNVFDLLDDDLTFRKAAEALNLPLDVLRDAVTVQVMRQARAVQAQQIQAGMEQQQTAATLKDVAPFMKNVSEMQRAA